MSDCLDAPTPSVAFFGLFVAHVPWTCCVTLIKDLKGQRAVHSGQYEDREESGAEWLSSSPARKRFSSKRLL